MVVALLLSGLILCVAIYSFRNALKTLRRLREEQFVASEEARFLRTQARRRMANSVIMTILATMLAGSYLSGVETRATELGSRNDHLAAGEERIPPTPEDREFFRLYVAIWASILLLTLVTVTLAILDFWATRRYAWLQLSQIRADHRVLLERDLAMARQQKLDRRIRFGTPPVEE
jgi:hypothetical protein